MTDIAKRFSQNPLLRPSDIRPSAKGLKVECLLNPGVFQFQNKTWMLLRVAERPEQKDGFISFPVLTPTGATEIIELKKDDPDLEAKDPRVITYKGNDYLTTLSHLRLVCSDDGINFHEPDGYAPLYGHGPLETFGIEDCRVSLIEGVYHLTFTSVSENGVAVGLRTTRDFKKFENHGLIFPPHNKDCALFEEKIGGEYFALHRPSSADLGGHYIWIARSPDGRHWGQHKCLAKSRKGMWDSQRVGAGASPIKTDHGWVEIYHGADDNSQYGLGVLLLDLKDPTKVLGRSALPIMVPQADYELTGFFGKVVFTNGHVVEPDGDTVRLYYGAADEVVCGAKLSIREMLKGLKAP
jgi:predicted GH43/DUF377 family glycosyl hydrolase